MCVAALAAGAREAVRMIRWRARVVGWAPILGPLLAVGVALLYTVFADQTLATVLEATRIRTELGPSLPWYGATDPCEALCGGAGGAGRSAVLRRPAGRRVVTAVRGRGGREPGAAGGPSRRLLGVIAGALLRRVFPPTRRTRHYGVFAGLGGALAVLTVIALR